MTPEEIVKDLIEGIESGKTYSSAANAAQAIKDYARSMLAKQRLNMRLYAVQNKMNYRDAIENAPYPKDLQ